MKTRVTLDIEHDPDGVIDAWLHDPSRHGSVELDTGRGWSITTVTIVDVLDDGPNYVVTGVYDADTGEPLTPP